MPITRPIEKVHLTAKGPGGETLAVATYTNGRCGITRDGVPIAGMEWQIEAIAECTAAMARLAGLSGRKG